MTPMKTFLSKIVDTFLREKPFTSQAFPGLLSDVEIEALCKGNRPMIAPFTHQKTGPGIISSGLTSYGYDATLAESFKVFTKPKTSRATPKVVDPKTFTQQSDLFYEFNAKQTTIPAHGFALAHTVEHFKMPKDVLGICITKSTYARCFTGDTRVAMADGTSKPFTELVQRWRNNEKLEGLSFDTVNNKVVVSELTAPRRIEKSAVIEIVLENNAVIRPTADHEFLIKVGLDYEMVRADALKLDMDLVWFSYHCAAPQKIKYIKPVPGQYDVYCLTVEDYGNFFLEAGLCVKNCGLQVVATPLQPGWEGQLVLELVNSTAHDSVVHAGEGICQLLFFRGSSACRADYAKLSGRYMHQTGVTPPLVK